MPKHLKLIVFFLFNFNCYLFLLTQELTAQSGDARGPIRAVQARATAPWWTKPVTVTPTGRGRAVTYQTARGPQTVTSEVGHRIHVDSRVY